MERAILVHVATTKKEKEETEESLQELAGLAAAAGAEVVHMISQIRPRISPRYFLGEGKLEEIIQIMEDRRADLIIFDHNLTAVQQKSIEDETRIKVIDRTQLILDIFAQRARTNEGKLQVELAQLSYLLPRLKDRGIAFTQQGAGIGTRGPGEKKLEEDRRRISDRITKIKKDILGIQKRRSNQRESRRKSPIPTVSLVGYTSAGKSTLFNVLAEERRYTSTSLFSTLDPLVRRVSFEDGLYFFLTDTVGFIKKLPLELVTSFKATLEEVKEADCICHIVDCTSPPSHGHLEAVESVLSDIGVSGIPVLKVFNKIDLLEETEKRILLDQSNSQNGNTLSISALTGEGTPQLLEKLREILFREYRLYYLQIPHDQPALVDSLLRRSLVLKRNENKDSLGFKVMAEPAVMIQFLPYLQQGGQQW